MHATAQPTSQGANVQEPNLESKVEGLCGEVTDDICQVTPPEGSKSLLCCDAGEAVDNASVSGDLPCIRHGAGRSKQLQALQGSHFSISSQKLERDQSVGVEHA